MVATKPRPQSLRKLAEQIDESLGLTVEIIGGTLVMPPSPRGKHAGIIDELSQQLGKVRPKGLAVREMVSVTAPHMDEDYVIPDLVVLSADFLKSDEWLAKVEDDRVEFVVEVVSSSSANADIVGKPVWYAEARVPLFLLIDPRHGTWRLYFNPVDNQYRGKLDGRFGDEVPLPEPLNLKLWTSDFLTYAAKRPSGRRQNPA